MGVDCGGHASQPFYYNNGNSAICTGVDSLVAGCRQASTNIVTPIANMHYDALQSQLKHQFANGYQVMLVYTWSKTTGMAGVNNEKSHPYINTPAFYYLNRGLAPTDRPQNFQAVFIGQAPFGAGKRWLNSGGIGGKILGGWQISGVMSKVWGPSLRSMRAALRLPT